MLQPENALLLVSIIDDDVGMRSSLIDLLLAADYQAIGFDSAEAFLGSNEKRISSCVITDIQMPGMDGFALKRRLDAERWRAPVIMMTARSEQVTEEQVHASGAFCFLRKPFSAAALLHCVEKSLAA